MIWANHPFRRRSLNALNENGKEGCAVCGRPPSVHRSPDAGPEDRNGRDDAERRAAAMTAALESELAQAGNRLVRDILEALCRRDGLTLESGVVPDEPARNYELADRLGIGHVFGLKERP